METLAPTLSAYWVQLPMVLVWLFGLILSSIYWQQHPKVSRLTAMAIVGFFIMSLIETHLSLWLPIILQERGWTIRQVGLPYQ